MPYLCTYPRPNCGREWFNYSLIMPQHLSHILLLPLSFSFPSFFLHIRNLLVPFLMRCIKMERLQSPPHISLRHEVHLLHRSCMHIVFDFTFYKHRPCFIYSRTYNSFLSPNKCFSLVKRNNMCGVWNLMLQPKVEVVNYCSCYTVRRAQL